ncbi:metal-binding protein [Rhodoplanes sp. Z2-YC6860]|nr:metal-binding protein [Rhodoplanes sp. Z2-YC6860]
MKDRAPPGRTNRGKISRSGDTHKTVENPSIEAAKGPWSVPVTVAEVPDTGRHVELVPDEATRDAIAQEAGLVALPRLVATFDLARRGADSLRLEGRVTATVIQNCVVTLEPIETEIDEPVELFFRPEPVGAAASGAEEGSHSFEGEEPPETLVNGTVDLGIIATEFLNLGIDPYPRKEGAVFDEPVARDPASHPFAALAALKKDPGSKGH